MARRVASGAEVAGRKAPVLLALLLFSAIASTGETSTPPDSSTVELGHGCVLVPPDTESTITTHVDWWSGTLTSETGAFEIQFAVGTMLAAVVAEKGAGESATVQDTESHGDATLRWTEIDWEARPAIGASIFGGGLQGSANFIVKGIGPREEEALLRVARSYFTCSTELFRARVH